MMQEAEHFVKTVEKYPCLWDVNLTTYKCKDTKNAAWKDVVRQTSVNNVTTAKEKWKKLRDSFRESIKRRKEAKSGNPVGIYKYYHVMKFLAPILENNSRSRETEESDVDSRASSWFSEDSLLPVPYDQDAENETVAENQNSREGVKRTAAEALEDADPIGRKKQRLIEDDSMDKFFLAMSANTKKLPHYLQLQIKRKVFNAVIEAEESDMWYNKFELRKSPEEQVFAAPLSQRSEETNFVKMEMQSPDELDSIEVKVENFDQITD